MYQAKLICGLKNITFKNLRWRSQKSIKEIADFIGVSESTYRKYECLNRVPTIPIVLKMVDIYDCSPQEILEACKNYYELKDIRSRYMQDTRRSSKKRVNLNVLSS